MNEVDKLKPVHPGEVLQEEFLKPLGLSQNRVALATRVPARRINEIIHSKRRITADVAEDELGQRLDSEVMVLESPAG
jgi:antitoxin HigA-1